jgi:hypothetical protein
LATIDDFSPDELRAIQHAPVHVIAGAVASEETGMTGSMVEMIDGVEGFAASMARAEDSLLTTIFQEIDETQPADFDITVVSDPARQEEIVSRGLAEARAAYDLLRARAGEADAGAYARALIDAARAAAHAARTGGFLGFGSEEVSEHEVEYVQRLARELGVTARDG